MTKSLRIPNSKSGVGHFIQQRVSAIMLVVLLPWFAISLILGTDGDFGSVQNWLKSPINAIGTVLLALIGIFHMRLGLQTIIEDYIEGHGAHVACLLINTALCLVLGVIAAISVARIFVGA